MTKEAILAKWKSGEDWRPAEVAECRRATEDLGIKMYESQIHVIDVVLANNARGRPDAEENLRSALSSIKAVLAEYIDTVQKARTVVLSHS